MTIIAFILNFILSALWGFARFCYCLVFCGLWFPVWIVYFMVGKGKEGERLANKHLGWVWYDI